jgi:hypothetical protein
MSTVRLTLLTLVLVIAVSCGRRAIVYWKDGNFEVYTTDADSSDTKLGYNHHPGTLGIVSGEVVAAGSTAQWVFVQQINKTSGQTEFYIIPKEGMPQNHSGRFEGPFSEARFQELRSARHFSDFTWRKKK